MNRIELALASFFFQVSQILLSCSLILKVVMKQIFLNYIGVFETDECKQESACFYYLFPFMYSASIGQS